MSALLVLLLAPVAAGVLWWLFAAGDDELLVVVPPGTTVRADAEVRVTGSLRPFAYDPALGDRASFGDFDDEQVLVAREIVPAGDDEGAGSIDLEDIDADLVGRAVTVTGEVAALLGPRALVLEDD